MYGSLIDLLTHLRETVLSPKSTGDGKIDLSTRRVKQGSWNASEN